jgi:hypothetical protein
VRPKTIVYFEWIIFGALLLGILEKYLGWDAIVWAARTNPNSPPVAFTLAILIFSFVLNGTLTLLVSRRRSKIAMWVLIALCALSVPSILVAWTRRPLESDIMSAAQFVSILVAYVLLSTPSARRWRNREDEKNEKSFSQLISASA